MIRLGIVDFDSSHSVEFTKRLNHQGVAEDQWVEGARVVAGCALPSAITEQAKVDEYARVFHEELGVPLVTRPEELIGKVDGVLIESVDGSVHLERARPFLEAGIPTYVDKPFTCSLESARALVDLAAKQGLPLFSSSSLRYAPDVVALRAHEAENGKVVGCDAYSPASTHPRNPGLFHYGIHGVETLYALMGPGCESVWCVSEEGADVVTGRWKDGRIGTLRGTRAGSHSYGFTAFCEKRVVPVTIGTQYIYRELLKQIVALFETGRSPLPVSETLEIVAFIEAALHSGHNHGLPRMISI
jgi:virulence factor